MRDTILEKASSEIAVEQYRQILMWPLLLRGPKETLLLPKDALEQVTAQLKTRDWIWADEDRWDEDQKEIGLKDLRWYKDEKDGSEKDEKDGSEHEYDYSEIVYFHSFVRDFLYGDGKLAPKERPMRVLHRTQPVHEMCVHVSKVKKHELDVARVELYLFETGVAILAIEIKKSQPSGLSLLDVLDLSNVVRMAFPRRWDPDGKPSEAPEKIILRTRCRVGTGVGMEDFPPTDYRNKDAFTKIVRDKAELPAAAHLKHLLEPLKLFGENASEGYSYQQILDQRLASMIYVAVEEPREISDWDFARLTFCDGAGDSRSGSYSEVFLQKWTKKYAYDRFWDRRQRADFTDYNNLTTTRWLCSGYGFAVVGTANSDRFTTHILANFRHHYFRMGTHRAFSPRLAVGATGSVGRLRESTSEA